MPAAAFIVPAVASVASSIIGSHAAKSAASQQQQAGTQAANTFQPYQQGGNAAFDKALGMYGIAPTASPTPPQPAPNPAMPPSIQAPRQAAGMTSTPPPPPTPPLVMDGGGSTLGSYGVRGGSSYGG